MATVTIKGGPDAAKAIPGACTPPIKQTRLCLLQDEYDVLFILLTQRARVLTSNGTATRSKK